MNLTNTTRLVESLLESYPETRDDDYLLWLKAVRWGVPKRDISRYLDMPFREFMEHAKYMKIPHYETVSRVMRKLQAEYPELRGTAETRAARAELENQYREYAWRDV